MIRLIICRHGQTEWNVTHRFQGQSDSPLTKLGREQAVALGRRLRDIKIDAVYCSSLKRAIDTAELAMDGRGIEIKLEDDLKEIYLGKLEGMTFEEGNEKYPEVMQAFWDITSGCAERESIGDVMRRASECIERIAQNHNNQTVLIITHGVVLRSLWVYLKKWPFSEAKNQVKPGSACFCDVLKRDGVWHITEWCDQSHLEGLEPTPPHPFI